ncbi:MAG TPA: DUF4388 domain-containing protein [Thermoanaerobaculia bacterium]|nr:DUF4388 domain-containing protein [Thermoanaerobaculia bacterium]
MQARTEEEDPSLSNEESSFQYRGDLTEVALPEILFTIDRFQVPGVMEATRGETVKRVFVREGNVVHATSSDLVDSLGHYLERNGLLGQDDVERAMAERERAQKRLGVLLIEMGLLSPAQVYDAIRKQTEGVVWSLFDWPDGRVTFKIGGFRQPEAVRIQLPMRQVILHGIESSPNAKSLVARLGRKETVFERCDRTEDLIETALDGDQMRLLELVDGRRSLFDVCTQGPRGVAENGKLLYAFQVLQLIRRYEAPASPPPLDESTGAIRIRFKTPSPKPDA